MQTQEKQEVLIETESMPADAGHLFAKLDDLVREMKDQVGANSSEARFSGQFSSHLAKDAINTISRRFFGGNL